MTDLIERYLAAIARDLPEEQRADIAAELRDEIMSRLEAREDELGRPLTGDEVEAVLVAFGHPLVVAGRYRKTQHLIGPEVFPFWWAGLRAALLMVAAVYLVLAVIAVVAGEESAQVADHAAPSLSVALVFTFGVVTLVCAAIERYGKTQLLARWKPRNLPPAKGRSRTRFEIMVEIAMGAAALAWWVGLLHVRNVLPGLDLRVDLAPVWAAWFWPITVYFIAEMAMNVLALTRPGRVRLNRALMLGRNLVAAAILGAVVRADRIVEVSGGPAFSPDVLAQVQANFDRGFRVGIGVSIGIFLCLAAIQVWRLRQLGLRGAAPRAA
jgi:hypothetical protein